VGAATVVSQADAPTHGPPNGLSYESAPERQEIVLNVGLGRLDSIGFIATQEDANSVRINVSVLHWHGTAPADRRIVYVPIGLESPLGIRSVLDAAGQPIPLRRR
jgi:hypothetical protein